MSGYSLDSKTAHLTPDNIGKWTHFFCLIWQKQTFFLKIIYNSKQAEKKLLWILWTYNDISFFLIKTKCFIRGRGTKFYNNIFVAFMWTIHIAPVQFITSLWLSFFFFWIYFQVLLTDVSVTLSLHGKVQSD